MPKKIKEKQLCVEDLRHAEYYGMQKTFDNLYAECKRSLILCTPTVKTAIYLPN